MDRISPGGASPASIFCICAGSSRSTKSLSVPAVSMASVAASRGSFPAGSKIPQIMSDMVKSPSFSPSSKRCALSEAMTGIASLIPASRMAISIGKGRSLPATLSARSP